MSAALNLEAERAAFEKCSRLLNPGDSLYDGVDSPVGWYYFDDAINDCWKVWRYARHTAPAVGADGLPVPHPDDAAVDRFAEAMKAKMAASRAKGRHGWDKPTACSAEDLQGMLNEHLTKGDPVDVGNFAMMLWNRGERTASRWRAFPQHLQELHDIIEPYAHSIIKRGFSKEEQDKRLDAIANYIEGLFEHAIAADRQAQQYEKGQK